MHVGIDREIYTDIGSDRDHTLGGRRDHLCYRHFRHFHGPQLSH
jgi:hypothetical protein